MKKNFNYMLVLLSLIAISFSSCEKKYEDGPMFSLRSAKARLAGDWKLSAYMVNGVDQTALVAGLSPVYKIEKGGTYTFTFTGMPVADSGTWAMGEDKDDVTFTSSTAGSTPETFRILKLKNKELWWKKTDSNGDVEEFHFIPE